MAQAADFMANYAKYYAEAFMVFDASAKSLEEKEHKIQDQKESDMKFLSVGSKYKHPFCLVVDFKHTYNGQPSVICPNCYEVDADNIQLGYCDDDVHYTCECYPQYNPAHTPQTEEGFPPPDCDKTEKYKQCAILPIVDGIQELTDKQIEEFQQLQIKITETALVKMSVLRDDGAFKTNMMPKHTTCMKHILPDSFEIPKEVHDKYIRNAGKKYEDREVDPVEDHEVDPVADLEEDICIINVNDKDDPIKGYRIFKMGIVEIMEFALEGEIKDFIIENLKNRFGLLLHNPMYQKENGGAKMSYINAAEEQILFLPVILRTFRPQIETNFSPTTLIEFDKLLQIVEGFWSFYSKTNRHGYVKYIFDIAKFFGFRFYDRLTNSDKLEFYDDKILYRGVCRCCDDLVYSFMADD